ncbi:hypothetical protein Tco_0436627 [Tanacetum coccineum]
MDEIDLILATEYSMPSGIENDDYDSEGDIRSQELLLSNDSLPLPENESSNLDHFNDPSSPRPPPEPPDVEICLNFEPDAGILMTKMVKGISEHYVLMPNTLPTLPTLDSDSDFTPSHDSLGYRNKIFDLGIFVEVQSERLLSRDEISISFTCDPLFDTLLPFSSKNEDKFFNPLHDLNCQQKVHIFYTGLDILTCRVLDSKGFIPLMTPTQALISIQVMAEHLHNWYDEATTREQINDSPNNIDTKKPKENIHVIQAADNEWIRKFIENTNSNIRALKTTTKNLQEKTYQLTQTVLTNTGEKVKAKTTMGKENVKEPVPRDLPVVQTYVPPTQFIGNPYRTHEIICAIGIPKEIHEDEGDMNNGCNIMVDDVERLRKILTPSIHTLPNLEPIVQPYMPLRLVCNKAKVVREKEKDYDIPLQDHIMQPLTPQTVHIAPPDDDYVAPATNTILNKLLNEFREEFADNTRVSEKIDSNPINDLKEILKTYDFETFIQKLLHQLSQSSHKTGSLYKEMEFEVSLTRVRVVERDQVSILAKDKGFRQEMHQKSLYSVTSPKDYTVKYSNEEMSHHTLYGVKSLQDYAATFKYTSDDVADSVLWRNICDRVTP